MHFTTFAGVVPQLARIHVASGVAERFLPALPAGLRQLPPGYRAVFGFLLGRDVLLIDSREAALFLVEAPDGVALVEARQQTAFLDMARRLGLRWRRLNSYLAIICQRAEM